MPRTAKNQLGRLVTNPADDCVLVLKPKNQLRFWIPNGFLTSIRNGQLPLHGVRAMVASHFLQVAEAEWGTILDLSDAAREYLEQVPTAEEQSLADPAVDPNNPVIRMPSFFPMMTRLQFDPDTDALLVTNRDDHNRVYFPDTAMESIRAGVPEVHIMRMMAIFIVLADVDRYHHLWRQAMDAQFPGYMDAIGWDGIVEALKQERGNQAQ